uniref:Lipoprotein n=1 Tax=Parastrongyloides trichosuri TaxID=131310 RepID=A0A0N4Z780_PARTI
MLKRFKILIISFSLFSPSNTCGSLTGGGFNDGEILQDPSFTFTVSPAVSWTYPPEIASPNPGIVFYFAGQSLTQSQAIQRAESDVTASILFAFDDENIPISRMTVTLTYSPDPIANCVPNTPIPSGTFVGLLAAGAIIEWATVTGASGSTVTLVNCPLSMNSISTAQVIHVQEYVKEVVVNIKGYATTRGTWRTIANNLLSILNFRFGALPRSQVMIN